ncbi:hypothetical protein GS901_05560 [Rhodococcus hoagii]|nr:hypothetical protein [Prescottella equi]
MQDVYDWAGEIRTVQTYAGDTGIPHDPPESIPDEAQRIFGELADANHLRGLSGTSSPRLSPSTGETSPHCTRSSTATAAPTPLRRPARRRQDGRSTGVLPAHPPSKRLETSLSSTAARSSATSSSPSSSPPAQSPPRCHSPAARQPDGHRRPLARNDRAPESTPNAPYTWASQHNRADHELADLAKLAASDFPSRPGAAISSTPRPTSTTSSRTTERTPNLGPGLER